MRHTHALLANYSAPTPCPSCDGEGAQLEIVWTPGCEEERERLVACVTCHGEGRVIALVCGRCGQEEHARPQERLGDSRACARCGHEAPHFLWLSMRGAQGLEETG